MCSSLLFLNLNITECDNLTIASTRYDIFDYDIVDDVDFLKNELPVAIDKLNKFAETRSLPLGSCKNINKVQIHQISNELLNDPSVSKLSYEIWGLYIPNNPELPVDTAVILLSPHGTLWNRKLLYHELAHYYFDNNCWSIYMNSDSEKIAREFENSI